MADIYKFPNNGYEVIVCKRQDIIDCINKNIVDIDIALAVVDQCEKDAAEFIKQGRWAGLPFIGNVRIPKAKLMEESPEQKELLKEAKELLDAKQYIMFRKKLSSENSILVKNNRYFNYITSVAANKNKKLYKKLCKEKGENYSRIFLFSCTFCKDIYKNDINDINE